MPDSDIADQGDIIKADVVGNHNIIGKNISIVINQAQTLGLNLLSPNYFLDNSNTEPNFKDWLDGSDFDLSAIFYGREYRRESLINSLKSKLENENVLLLVGETGVAKSTLFMEIVSDYYKDNYIILLNNGNKKLGEPEEITQFIRDLVNNGNKVLIAIDDTHSLQMASAYHIVKLLESFQGYNKIRFLMTARQPDLDSLVVTQKKYQLLESHRRALESFFRKDYTIHVPYLNLKEVTGFIKKYQDYYNKNDNTLEENATIIFSETRGHPILVKFFVLGKGLKVDVENRYSRYLSDEHNKTPDPKKVETVILCSLHKFSNIDVTSDFLGKIGLLDHAKYLEKSILFFDTTWNTLHPIWDLELFSLLCNFKEIGTKRLIEKSFLNAISNILDNCDDEVIFTILDATINPIIRPFFSIESLRNLLKESSLSDDSRSRIYGLIIAANYLDYNEIENAIACFDDAIELNENDAMILYSAGIAYDRMGGKIFDKDYEQAKINFLKAIDLYDKAIKLNPRFAVAMSNKCNTLLHLNRSQDAKTEINLAVAISPEDDIIWFNKGIVHLNLQEVPDALSAFDRTTTINDVYIHAWFYKAVCFEKLGNKTMAEQCLGKVKKINPNFELLIWFDMAVRSTGKGVKVSLFDYTEPVFSNYYTKTGE